VVNGQLLNENLLQCIGLRALQSFRASGATCPTRECNISEDSSTQVLYCISVVGIPPSTLSATHQQLQAFEISASVLEDPYYLQLLFLLAGFGGET
jgi:hypothetical protein